MVREGVLVEGLGERMLVCVLLRFRRSMELSMVVDFAGLVGLWSLIPSELEEGSRIARKPSFSPRPSCQLAFAHQPTTSSLMLSKVSFCLMYSSTQCGKR